ncbi:hypothetical protein K439DRAFT_1615699 [Ramaria rubella]|nr:hypothetical protein K439DRAFT_1615699 [Ramaria rubella]
MSFNVFDCLTKTVNKPPPHILNTLMVNLSLKLMIQHVLTPQEYPSHPQILQFDDDSWKYWLDSERSVYVNWRLKKQNIQAKSGQKQKYDWKVLYECDHAGHPHNRRDEALSPHK